MNPRTAIAETTAGLFTHAAYPLADSLDFPGDPGLFGPGSASWEVIGDVATFVGGIRALLIQSAHPEVVAGVADHSAYATDPLGRLSRTSAYVTAAAFGAMPEVDEAIRTVRVAHRPVKGASHRGKAYSAADGAMASWVHNVLVDSFLVTHQRFGQRPLTPERADAFVAEQRDLGQRLGATELPGTAADLSRWIDEHPAIGPSPAMEDVVRFLHDPPLPGFASLGYRRLFGGAASTLTDPISEIIGVQGTRSGGAIASAVVRTLRWSLGSSPSWWLALVRTSNEAPGHVSFRRMPPVKGFSDAIDPRADRDPQGMGDSDR